MFEKRKKHTLRWLASCIMYVVIMNEATHREDARSNNGDGYAQRVCLGIFSTEKVSLPITKKIDDTSFLKSICMKSIKKTSNKQPDSQQGSYANNKQNSAQNEKKTSSDDQRLNAIIDVKKD